MTERIDPAQLWLGACVGAQVLVVVFCVIKANAYRERALLLHAAAAVLLGAGFVGPLHASSERTAVQDRKG